MKLKKLRFLILLFYSICHFTGIAQKVYSVGIQASKINYVVSIQKKPQWCWAASIQMVLNYYNVAITQEQIVERTYGREVNGQLPNWSASLGTIHQNLNNWSVDNGGKQYIVNAQVGLGAPEPILLIKELSQKRPVIIGYQSHSGGHAVVITGLRYIESDFGLQIMSIIIWNPISVEVNKSTHGLVEYDAATLAKRINAYWLVRVMIGS